MIIGVDFKKEFSETAWIIPIPAKPENVKIFMEENLGSYEGTNTYLEWKKKLFEDILKNYHCETIQQQREKFKLSPGGVK